MSEPDARDGRKQTLAGAAMSIDSFSQLPFIRTAAAAREGNKRPPPSTSSGTTTAAGIRLFGFDVPPEAAAAATATSLPTTGAVNEAAAGGGVVEESAAATPSSAAAAAATTSSAEDNASRKFECQYCCRNFPTSQALGGHQNAHKRERQHAKRAQFQTAMAMHHAGQYYPLPDPAHLYATSSTFYPHPHRFSATVQQPPPPPHYPSWAGAGYYTGPGSISQPINGCPVAPSTLWQVPPGVRTPVATARSQEQPAPPLDLHVLGGEEPRRVTTAGAGDGSRSFSPSASSSSSSASPNKRPAEAPPERKENVSLDLSL